MDLQFVEYRRDRSGAGGCPPTRESSVAPSETSWRLHPGLAPEHPGPSRPVRGTPTGHSPAPRNRQWWGPRNVQPENKVAGAAGSVVVVVAVQVTAGEGAGVGRPGGGDPYQPPGPQTG